MSLTNCDVLCFTCVLDRFYRHVSHVSLVSKELSPFCCVVVCMSCLHPEPTRGEGTTLLVLDFLWFGVTHTKWFNPVD